MASSPTETGRSAPPWLAFSAISRSCLASRFSWRTSTSRMLHGTSAALLRSPEWDSITGDASPEMNVCGARTDAKEFGHDLDRLGHLARAGHPGPAPDPRQAADPGQPAVAGGAGGLGGFRVPGGLPRLPLGLAVRAGPVGRRSRARPRLRLPDP